MISLDETDVPVIVGVEESGLRMSSGGSEIGEWALGEFSIDHDGRGVYTITAENESLRFVPNEPSSFAASLGLEEAPDQPASDPESAPTRMSSHPSAEIVDDSNVPAPSAVTRVVFYVIAAGTAAMGVWALVSLF